MLNQLIKFLIIILFITLALINSHLLDFFGLKNFWKYFYVNWNYEFSKITYFNIFSSIILFLFLIKIFLEKKVIKIPYIIFYIFISFLISTFYSISPYISFFWNNIKSHWFIIFNNLIGLFIIFLNIENKNKEKILKYSLIGLLLSIIFAIWQLYFPTFNYWNLKNRAFWFFGHPNYLALYILIYIPILINNKLKINKQINFTLTILSIATLLLTKSLTAIFLAFSYLIYYYYNKNKKLFFIISFIFFFSIFYIFYTFWFSKFHSFISRFFIWKWSFLASIENLKTILIWNWFETLDLIFNKYKSPFLYIFENIWFTADRAHNIFLYFFYSTWILWLIWLIYIFYFTIKNKNKIYKTSIILAFLFLLFNFSSITIYLLLILLISLLNYKFIYFVKNKVINYIFIILISIISFYWSYNSILFYKAETKIYKNSFFKANKIYKFFPNYFYKNNNFKEWLKLEKIKTEYYFKSKIIYDPSIKNCKLLIKNYKTIENYFFCWDIFKDIWKNNISIFFYKEGLKLIPDLWNKNSKFHKYKIVKYTINWKRFFSQKYSNIKKILKITWNIKN